MTIAKFYQHLFATGDIVIESGVEEIKLVSCNSALERSAQQLGLTCHHCSSTTRAIDLVSKSCLQDKVLLITLQDKIQCINKASRLTEQKLSLLLIDSLD
jgi:hypothetical protein